MEVRVLGPVQVVDGDREVKVGRMERLLLARLVAGRGRAVSDDALIDALWGERPPPSAHKTLQGHVHRLRRAIGDSSVIRLQPGYALSANIVVDVDVVEAFASRARLLVGEGRLDDAAELYDSALSRFRGEALRELEDDPSASGLRRQLAELELTLAEDRLVNEIDRGHHRHVVGELEHLIGRDATRERAWCLLVTALAACGRQSDALDAVARARRALAVELGIEPGPRLREVELAVLEQRLSPPSNATNQTDVEGSTAPATCHSTAQLHPGRLPAWDTRFWGRSDEIAWLSQRVLITTVTVLTGPGGVGKTRLAAQVARQVDDQFTDGVYFVGLAGIVDDAIECVIAQGVGVRREPNRSPLDSLMRPTTMASHVLRLASDVTNPSSGNRAGH